MPVYFNPHQSSSSIWGLAGYETSTQLNFSDSPQDNCLPGGTGGNCNGQTAPAGSKLAFTTHLVGLQGSLNRPWVCDTGMGFSWTDNYNFATGGVNLLMSPTPAPTGGTGGITITAYSDSSPSSSTPILVENNQVTITVSALDSTSAIVTITNVSANSIDGPLQIVFDSLTSGVILTDASGTFGGWTYVTVPNADSLAPNQSVSTTVQFSNPSNQSVSFVPIVYSGDMD